LLAENSVSSVEIKTVDEDEVSAALVTEKWSHEAIVARSNLRPERMQKLKVAAVSGGRADSSPKTCKIASV
jgi:hypothetical protein